MKKQKTFSKPSDKIYDKMQLLKMEIIEEIRKATNSSFFNLEENTFEDEASNDIEAVCYDTVYFNGGETYPLWEMGIQDAIYLLQIIEHMKEYKAEEAKQ